MRFQPLEHLLRTLRRGCSTRSKGCRRYPCQIVTEVERPMGDVPHHLPGTNPFLDEFSRRTGVPFEATRGGAETMYPEYVDKVKAMPRPPALR